MKLGIHGGLRTFIYRELIEIKHKAYKNLFFVDKLIDGKWYDGKEHGILFGRNEYEYNILIEEEIRVLIGEHRKLNVISMKDKNENT